MAKQMMTKKLNAELIEALTISPPVVSNNKTVFEISTKDLNITTSELRYNARMLTNCFVDTVAQSVPRDDVGRVSSWSGFKPKSQLHASTNPDANTFSVSIPGIYAVFPRDLINHAIDSRGTAQCTASL